MKRDKKLIKRQELLDFIVMWRGRYGMSPTLKDMAIELYGDARYGGNVLTMLVNPLIEEGFLYRAGGAKSIMLVTPQPRETYYAREDEREKVS